MKYGERLSKFIKRSFAYCPETGVITSLRTGKTDWRKDKQGYQIVAICDKNKRYQYAAHRMAWFLHTGSWPVGLIDHINRVKDDNRFDNLRDTTHKVNSRNRRDNHMKDWEYIDKAEKTKMKPSVYPNAHLLCG